MIDIKPFRERIAALEASLTAERARADRLAAALEDAKLQIQYLDDPYQRHATSETVLARIDAALAAHRQARGEG